jgi:hypothetical protein
MERCLPPCVMGMCAPSARVHAVLLDQPLRAISFPELLQPWRSVRHRPIRLLPALLASAPPALVRASVRAPALLAPAPDALMLADGEHTPRIQASAGAQPHAGGASRPSSSSSSLPLAVPSSPPASSLPPSRTHAIVREHILCLTVPSSPPASLYMCA